MKIIKKLFSSRKFTAIFSGIITSILVLILGKVFSGEDEKIIEISQQISALILIGMSVYAGSQGIADHGDENYGKSD